MGDAVRWIPAEPEVEIFLNAISFFFPPGEKFFIDSVQAYQDRISDPVLQEQVRRFILKISVGVEQTDEISGRLWVLNGMKESPDG
jgi:predicted metal-dependent hydrolase